MKTPHIIKSDSIIAFINGKPVSAKAGTLQYKRALSAIKSEDEEAFLASFAANEDETIAQETGFQFVNGNIVLDGVEVIGALQQKLRRMIAEDIPVGHFVNFIRNLRQNPSRQSILETYDFLAYRELPITEDGYFIGYKGIREDGYSVRSGSLVPIKGKVHNGHVYNEVGEEILCERSDVDDDRNTHCSQGLHIGSLDYALNWGARTVIVKVHPKNVVSVPSDCDCQKMRTCGYTVMSEFTEEINSAVVQDDLSSVTTPRKELGDRLKKTIRKMTGHITLRRLQSALSPACPPVHDIRDIVSRDLGYDIAVDPEHKTSVSSMFVVK